MKFQHLCSILGVFFSKKCTEYIAYQSNVYATQKDGKVLSTSFGEIEQFIGTLLLTGVFSCISYRSYWTNFCRFNMIADVMSRNRFELLLRYIHFNDNTNMKPREHPQYNPLFKISTLLDRFRSAMQSIEPKEMHAIDEQMIPFKGRSSRKQYMKKKPYKWGFKVFAQAGTSGIIYDFEVDTRKSMQWPGELGVSGNVVLRLIQNFNAASNFEEFFDNLFSLVGLVECLKQKKIWTVGIIRPNRLKGCTLLIDQELKNKGRGACDFKVDQEHGVIIVKWYDNRPVQLISSYSGVEPRDKFNRWSVASKQRVEIDRPSIVKEYNRYMDGVDLCDMMIEFYRTNIRNNKWYMRIVYYCINLAVVN